MNQDPARRLKVRRRALGALGALLAAFLLVTCTPLGLPFKFPPAVWWAQRLNRWEFERHQQGYRDMAARITKDMAGTRPGTHLFYELSVTRDPSSLRRMEPPVAVAVLEKLFAQGLLVEAHRFKGEFAVRFVTRKPMSGGSFNLIYWSPGPNPNSIWWGSDWWENETIEWLDPYWWSTYVTFSDGRGWNVVPRGPKPKVD